MTFVTWMRKMIVPLLLMVCCPPIAIFMWYVNVHLGGSVVELWNLFRGNGFFTTISQVWGPIFFGSPTAWKMILIFASSQLLLMKVLPGKTIEGPITPNGNTPRYKANGIPSFLLTITLFFVASEGLNLF